MDIEHKTDSVQEDSSTFIGKKRLLFLLGWLGLGSLLELLYWYFPQLPW